MLMPLAFGHAVAILSLWALGEDGAPPPALVACAAIAGVCFPPSGSVLRSRWHEMMGGDAELLRGAFAFDSVMIEVSFVSGPLITAILVALIGPQAALAASAVLVVAGTCPLRLEASGGSPGDSPRGSGRRSWAPASAGDPRRSAFDSAVRLLHRDGRGRPAGVLGSRGLSRPRRRPPGALVAWKRRRRPHVRRKAASERPLPVLPRRDASVPARLPAARAGFDSARDGNPRPGGRRSHRPAHRDPQPARGEPGPGRYGDRGLLMAHDLADRRRLARHRDCRNRGRGRAAGRQPSSPASRSPCWALRHRSSGVERSVPSRPRHDRDDRGPRGPGSRRPAG